MHFGGVLGATPMPAAVARARKASKCELGSSCLYRDCLPQTAFSGDARFSACGDGMDAFSAHCIITHVPLACSLCLLNLSTDVLAGSTMRCAALDVGLAEIGGLAVSAGLFVTWVVDEEALGGGTC